MYREEQGERIMRESRSRNVRESLTSPHNSSLVVSCGSYNAFRNVNRKYNVFFLNL